MYYPQNQQKPKNHVVKDVANWVPKHKCGSTKTETLGWSGDADDDAEKPTVQGLIIIF